DGINQMAKNVLGKQQRLGGLLLSEMSVLCREELSSYQDRLKAYEARRAEVAAKASSLSAEEERLRSAIKKLKAELHPTDGIMEDINRQLTNLGFTGFFLRPSPDVENAYEISRHAGGKAIPAEGLSEGEKDAIAFIYFKSLVYGSPDIGMAPSPKIVIFDDFISSIDSDISFWVATQVRKMIRECLDNDAPLSADAKRPVIRQVFLLTHNVYFYNEIATPFFSDYAHCTCFEIRKDLGNKSSIEISEAKSEMDGQSRNIIPVRMRYDGLWRDFLQGTDPRELLRIARNILEYNFVYHGGYIDGSLRKALLVEHADKFYDPGTGDDTDFLIVEELLSAFEVNREGFHDGMYLDLDSLSPDRIRHAVRTVFSAMGQGRHYEWMCEKV
ncbi:MAG: AAA family ATPase, partial [Blautia sp.]|nr:AAA family ATPase [Blautia sp.]